METKFFKSRKTNKTFTIDELIEYYKEHRSCKKTAEHFGISAHTATTQLKKANVKICGNIKELPNDLILQKYREGKKIKRIALEHGVSFAVILRILKLNNIEIRKKGRIIEDEIVKKYKEGKTINRIYHECGVYHEKIKKILISNNIDIPKRIKPDKVTIDEIREAALKFKHRVDFSKGNLRCYRAAISRNIMDDVCSHMEILGDAYKRLVYVYEFEDKHVYVGLTYNKNIREYEHINLRKSPVYRHMQKTGLKPKRIIVSDDYISAIDAQKLEDITIEKYKEDGWQVLNKAKAGGLGGTAKKWSEEALKEEALKYNTRKELIKNSPTAYSIIIRKKLRHFLSHMKWEGGNSHTLEECIEEAKKYDTKKEFRKSNFRLLQYIYRRGYHHIVFRVFKKIVRKK